MTNIIQIISMKTVAMTPEGDARKHLSDCIGVDTLDFSQPFVAYEKRDEKKEYITNKIADGFESLQEHVGTALLMIPMGDDKYYNIEVSGRTIEDATRMAEAETKLRAMFGSVRDIRASSKNPLAIVLGAILGGVAGVNIFDMRDPDMDDDTICKPYVDKLTPESKIKFFPRNDRTGENIIELDYQQYRHLLSVGMIDHCPVCTKRERELVVHEEDDHTFKGIKTYLIAADAQIHSVPAR